MTDIKHERIAQDSNVVNVETSSLRSVYSENLPDILSQLGISLAISTYQAGKVILVSAENGTIATHFHDFGKPMGIAVHNQSLTIGGQNSVWFYRNTPALSPTHIPDDHTQAFYTPQHTHVTGDIDIHEMAWGKSDLWIVNTKYSTLCTLDADHSFTPHWRPHFITELSPEDRCHLNGLALVNGQPKYVTALGAVDTAGGWRENKRSGGILMDVESNQILARDLSMPHSPRLYNDKVWLLESGTGGLGWYEPNGLANGNHAYQTIETIAQLPGFTRGLDFAGPLAFIGLSQVRQSAVFSDIPLVENIDDRVCGVWVVNIHTGQTVAYLRFEGEVQEIFAVQVIWNRHPEIQETTNHTLTQPNTKG